LREVLLVHLEGDEEVVKEIGIIEGPDALVGTVRI
jgi:hypothetical protein